MARCSAFSPRRTVDIGTVAYQMALFSERAGEVLTPEVREELKAELVSTE